MSGPSTLPKPHRSLSGGVRPTDRLTPGTRRRRRMSTLRQRGVVIGALVVMATEIAGLAGLLPTPALGSIPISLAVVPALVVTACLGRAAWGRANQANAVGALWITVGLGVVISAVLLARTGNEIDVISIALASGTEEIVYRFSVPVVIAAVLLRLRVPDGAARGVGYGVAAMWFVLLPGHTAQAGGLVELAPFIAFAVLAAVVVARSGALVAVAGAHTTINLLTEVAANGQMSEVARTIEVGIVLILLVAAYGRPIAARRRAEPGVPATAAGATGDGGGRGDAVIDLTDGATSGSEDEPAIDLTDGAQEPDHAGDDRAGAHRHR